MPMLEWDDSLNVNVEKIDTQHKELVNMVNDLFDAMTGGANDLVATDLVGRLKEYALHHFATEEKYMEEYKYPDAQDHIPKHDDFRNKAAQIEADCNSGNFAISMDLLNFLSDWLVTHINGTDKKFGEFLNKAEVH